MRERTSFHGKPLLDFAFILGLDFAAQIIRRAQNTLLASPGVLFSRAILNNPLAIGAVCPSSSRLARALACLVPLQADGLVLELGAGTGRVTEALLERGVDPEKLVVVERDRFLANHLKDQFTNVSVLHGNAVKLCEMCNRYDRHVACVVSSLPLLSLSPATVEALGENLRKLLGRDGTLVQYTYRLNNSPSPLAAYMERISTQTIWGNIPPAKVEVFRSRI